ncbi:S-adenosyl-L-methionine-dependent methyltransferase, partial [Sistotremastrum suecicum HHB10207 ss-3]
MSLRLPHLSEPLASIDSEQDSHSGSSSSEDEEDDQTWDDWVSDSAPKSCTSLFDKEKSFDSVEKALEYDKDVKGFDLQGTCQRLSLSFHQRIRLINHIRKEAVAPASLEKLSGKEPFFSDDQYLKPALEDDPLLQYSFDDWSEGEDEEDDSPERTISLLKARLAKANQDLATFRQLVTNQLDITALGEAGDAGSSTEAVAPRDDDSHYFRSYADNEIHSVMLQDTVRTSTYASFILSNPSLFDGATVLDVGCGTGILSLFAARAGAAKVYAVDASDIAVKAEKIVKENGLENVITVIRGKVEDIVLPVEKVDIIISEWMGYALLYESMLDSVLHARDRFLKPGGLLAPSESRMMFSLCEAKEVKKERIGFWDDVYGFDLSSMAEEVYDDAIIDVVPEESLVSDPTTIKTFDLHVLTPKKLDFSSPFTLTSTRTKRTKAWAFVLYFDTFFNTVPTLLSPEDPAYEVTIVKADEPNTAEVWAVGKPGRGELKRRASSKSGEKGKKAMERYEKGYVKSFSTGPASLRTHWQQTVFLLREGIPVEEGTVVEGTFSCRKSEDNSRELDVEIRYSVKPPGAEKAGDTIIQIYKVR